MSIAQAATISPRRVGNGWSFAIGLALGSVLLAAAILKVRGDAFTPDAETTTFFTSRPIILAEAGIELALGAALIAGLWPRVIRKVAMAFFAVVFCVAATEAIQRKASCGCFGQLVVPPWVTALGDAAALAALWFCPPRDAALTSTRRLMSGIGLLLAIVGICLGIEVRRPHFVTLGRLDGDVPGQSLGTAGASVDLRPSQWVGNRFPLAAHIAVVGPQLMQGRWIVLLVHHDCAHCLAAIDMFEAESINAISKPGAPGLVVIELPPYSDPDAKLVHPPTVLGALDESRDWYAPTPVALLLENGIVKAESETNEAGEPDSKWWGR